MDILILKHFSAMFNTRWIFLFGFSLIYSFREIMTQQFFSAQPHTEPYFVRPNQQNVVLPCAFQHISNPNVKYSVYWIRFSSSKAVIIAQNGQHYEIFNGDCSPGVLCFHLRIKNVTFEDNGMFTCQVNIAADDEPKQAQSAKVVVLVPPGPPTIISQPNRPLIDNEFVELGCSSTGGNPAPKTLWLYANGTEFPILSQRQMNASHSDDATMSFINFHVTAQMNNVVVICRVWNEAIPEGAVPLDAVSTPFNVIYSPRIVIGPSSPYNVEEGSAVSMFCQTDSNPPVNSTKWLFNEEPIPKTEGRKFLNFTAIQRHNNGVYSCEALSPAGSGTGRLKLNVFYVPEIKLQSEYRAAAGKSIVLICQVDSNPFISKISWTGPNGYSSDTNTLELKDLSLNDMGNYTCQASNEMILYGMSNAVIRTASKSTHLIIDHAPGRATVVPPDRPVSIGSYANLTCTAEDPGSPLALYRWKMPWQKQFDNEAPPRQSLQINEAKLSDAGEYACQPYNDIGIGEIGTYYLTVYVPAKIERGPQSLNGTKKEGDTGLQLSCLANGQPAPNVTWVKDGELLMFDDKVDGNSHWSISNTVDTSHCHGNETCIYKVLSILSWRSGAVWTDKGVYGCWAFNGAGHPVTANVSLSLNHSPIILNDPGRPFVAVDLRQSAALICRANSKPEPSFAWFREGGAELAPRGSGAADFTVEQRRPSESEPDVYESYLIIRSVQELDMGEYTCKVSNVLGQASYPFILQTKTKPMDPTHLRSVQKTHESVALAWTPGFNGGEEQYFVIEVLHPNSQIRFINVTEGHAHIFKPGGRYRRFVGIDRPREIYFNITNLLPASEYKFRLRAANRIGSTDWTPYAYPMTEDAPLDNNLPSASDATYNSDSMILNFKPTSVDPTAFCLLVYRQLPSGKFGVQNCYSPANGFVDNLKPASSFKIRFCHSQSMTCGPERYVPTNIDSPFTWQLIIALVGSLTLSFLVALALGVYCCRTRRLRCVDDDDIIKRGAVTDLANDDHRTSPSSSIVTAGRFTVHQNNNSTMPMNQNNDLSANSNRNSSPDDNYSPRNAIAASDLDQRPRLARVNASNLTRMMQSDSQNLHNLTGVGGTCSTGHNNSAFTLQNDDHVRSPGDSRHTNGSKINRPPSYDDQEHWGVTDGYGLSQLPSGGVSSTATLHVSGAKNFQNKLKGGGASAVSASSTAAAASSGGGGANVDSSTPNIINGVTSSRGGDSDSLRSDFSASRRVMKEIIV